MEWGTFIREIGVPGGLLFALLLGGWRLVMNHLVPMLERLVQSHLALVEEVKSSNLHWAQESVRILQHLEKQGELISQIKQDVAEILRQQDGEVA